ncbi:MAG: hypothetical protein AAF567_07955 [Actinomycetota bacterium]
MVIRKGQAWGSEGTLAPDAPVVASDRALAEAVAEGAPQVRPTAGDLAATLGVNDRTNARAAQMLLPVDALRVTLDGSEGTLAVAHVVVGALRRPRTLVMNAAFLGAWNPAPRAHPGDGRLDIVDFEVGIVDWWKAKRRLPTGTHVPHPGVRVRSARRWERDLEGRTPVRIDGRTVIRASHIVIEVVDEAFIAGV